MAEQITYGVKVEQNLRDLLKQLEEQSGSKTGAEFLQRMAENFQSAQSRETLVNDKELKLVENHLARINEIIIGMAKARHDENEVAKITTADLIEKLKSTKADLVDAQELSRTESLELNGQINIINENMRQLRHETDNQIIEVTNAMVKLQEAETQARRMFEKLDAVNQQITAQSEELKFKAENSDTEARAAKEEAKTCVANLSAANKELTYINQLLDSEKEKANRTIHDMERQLESERQDNLKTVANIRQVMELNKREALIESESKSLEHRRILADELETLRRELSATKAENAELKSKLTIVNPIK